MIDIETLRNYFIHDTIVLSQHSKNRCSERGIKQTDIKACVMSGEIIKQYPDDLPFPSCLVFGHTADNRIMHAVISSEGECGRIITAYIPSADKFEEYLKTGRRR